MSAATRAEARRKAILSRGTDRLAKLTTTARGEDAEVYRDATPPPGPGTRSFLGEESTNMPAPAPLRASSSPGPSPSKGVPAHSTTQTNPNPANAPLPDTNTSSNASSAWSPEEHQQFMQALMNASSLYSNSNANTNNLPPGANPDADRIPLSPFGEPMMTPDPSLPPMDNPFAALLGGAGGAANPFTSAGPGLGGGANPNLFPPGALANSPFDFSQFPLPQQTQAEPPKPPSKLQKALPVLHLVAMWGLLAYFVLWVEPRAYGAASGSVGVGEGLFKWGLGRNFWGRWAALGGGSGSRVNVGNAEGWMGQVGKLQLVPFFWAFTTLQIILHSLRIFAGFDTPQPPTLLALALPHLPPPLPSLIINALKYMQMGSFFLNDLAGLLVGIGVLVLIGGLVGGSS